VETIVLSDDDSLDQIKEIDRKKENIYSNKKGKSKINCNISFQYQLRI
jgi:hypothetical protein